MEGQFTLQSQNESRLIETIDVSRQYFVYTNTTPLYSDNTIDFYVSNNTSVSTIFNISSTNVELKQSGNTVTQITVPAQTQEQTETFLLSLVDHCLE